MYILATTIKGEKEREREIVRKSERE